jgi:hypothetical protein
MKASSCRVTPFDRLKIRDASMRIAASAPSCSGVLLLRPLVQLLVQGPLEPATASEV